MMRHPSIETLYTHWCQLRGDRFMPYRHEFDPRNLGRDLGDIFILKGLEQNFSFRLAGSRIESTLGRSLSKVRFPDLWNEADCRLIHRSLVSVVEEVSPILISFRAAPLPDEAANAQIKAGIKKGRGEIILLPLHAQSGEEGVILGSLGIVEYSPLFQLSHYPLEITSIRVIFNNAFCIKGHGIGNKKVNPSYLARTSLDQTRNPTWPNIQKTSPAQHESSAFFSNRPTEATLPGKVCSIETMTSTPVAKPQNTNRFGFNVKKLFNSVSKEESTSAIK